MKSWREIEMQLCGFLQAENILIEQSGGETYLAVIAKDYEATDLIDQLEDAEDIVWIPLSDLARHITEEPP
jgi:hypothetical protein